jgi:hypothetical protein
MVELATYDKKSLLGRGRSISPKQYPLSIETLADAVPARSWVTCGLQVPTQPACG